MFGKSYPLFKLFGFSVRVDWSWLIIVALVVWSLAAGFFPAVLEGRTWPTYLLMGIAGALGLFISIVFHELSHSLVARRFGMPMKGITLFIFGGVAEMSDEPPSPKAEFWMAAAGPISSLVLAGILYGCAALWRGLGLTPVVSGVLAWMAMINLILAAFNLIPGFPLDGGRILRAALWRWKNNLRRATYIASRVGAVFGIGLVVLGFASILMGNPIGGL